MERPMRKEDQEEKPGTSKNNDTTQSNENSLDLNNSLPYDILRIIFEYLNGKDLANAAMVCRTWLEVANNEKRMRRGPYCFLISKYLCNRDNFLNYIRVKPSIVFIFSSEDFEEDATLVTEFMSLVPACCKAVLLSSDYCFTNKTLRSKCKEFSNPIPICVFLSQIPNVIIKSFVLVEPDSCTIQETTEYQEIISTINHHKTSMLNCETSTCFLLFCSQYGLKIAGHWALTILERKEIAIDALCGGIFDDIFFKYPDNLYERISKKKKPHCVAVLITGLIQTWFTTLDDKCNTTKQIEARLKLFKDEVKLKKHSIGFIFVDEKIHRRYNNYDTSNYMELIIFKRLFPKLPLAGCFSLYEIGTTTLVEENEEEKRIEEEREFYNYPHKFNEMSIVFLILTYD